MVNNSWAHKNLQNFLKNEQNDWTPCKCFGERKGWRFSAHLQLVDTQLNWQNNWMDLKNKQNPLEKLIFTICQNYTLALVYKKFHTDMITTSSQGLHVCLHMGPFMQGNAWKIITNFVNNILLG